MSATVQAQKSSISLAGSVATVTEFFGFAVNNILYQRAIYPPDSFAQVSKYGLPMMVTTDDPLKKYLGTVLTQLANWLSRGDVQKLVLVVTGVESHQVLERWVFDVDLSAGVAAGGSIPPKNDDVVRAEIQAIMRQITASVTFLPVVEEPCAFDLLIYANSDVSVPQSWELSDPQLVKNPTDVKLRSFSTQFHKVDAAVSYQE